MKQTTQTLKEKYLIPEVEITNLLVEQGFDVSINTPGGKIDEDEEETI